MKTPYTYNTLTNPHDEIGEVEKIIKSHISWAVNNKDRQTLFSTIIENDEYEAGMSTSLKSGLVALKKKEMKI